jgi:chromosome segregation ATPase
MESVVKNSGVVDSFSEMMKSQERTASAAQSVVSGQADMAASVKESATTQESLADSFKRTEDNIKATKEYQDKLANANDATSKYEQKRDEAYQQLRAQQAAEMAMTTANHDNIAAIRESVSKLDELSNYLSPILDENRNQSNLLQSLAEKVDKLVLAVTNKAAQPAPTSVVPNVNTSYNERNRIYGPVKTW